MTTGHIERTACASGAKPIDPVSVREAWAGHLLQIMLGVLIGFSAIQDLGGIGIRLPVDAVCFPLVFLALFVAGVSVPHRPRLRFTPGKPSAYVLAAVFAWYLIFSLASHLRFSLGVLANSAEMFLLVIACAALALPAVWLGLLLVFARSSSGSLIPGWTALLLAFGLWGLPLNVQLGQLPVVVLAFVAAYYAGYLAKSPKVLLTTVVAVALGLVLMGLDIYIRRGDYTLVSREVPYPHRFGGPEYGLTLINWLGQHLVLVVAACLALFSYIRARTLRLLLGLATGALVLSIGLTQSRGAILGIAATLVIYVTVYSSFARGKWRRVLACGLVLVTVLSVVYMSTSAGKWKYRGALGHWSYFSFAIDQFKQSPWIGNGFSSWHCSYADHTVGYVSDRYSDCDNIVGEILSGAGLVGFFAAVFVAWCCGRLMSDWYQSLSSSADRRALGACAAGIIGYALTQNFRISFCSQAATAAVPAILGVWWGVVMSRERDIDNPGPRSSILPAFRFILPLCLLLGTVVVAVIFCGPIKGNRDTFTTILAKQHFVDKPYKIRESPTCDVICVAWDRNSRPLPGAWVSLSGPHVKLSGTTDANGTFVFQDVPKRPNDATGLNVSVCYPGRKAQVVNVRQPAFGDAETVVSWEPKSRREARKIEQQARDIEAWFPPIKAGELCSLDSSSQATNFNYPGPGKFSGKVRFYPEPDSLRIMADVTDAYFSTDAPAEKEWRASSMELYVSATGLDDDLVQFFFVPKGPLNAAKARGVRYDRGSFHSRDISGTLASWSRTANGYLMDIKVPYKLMPDYDERRGFIVLELSINTRAPQGGTTLRLNSSQDPCLHVSGFSRLHVP